MLKLPEWKRTTHMAPQLRLLGKVALMNDRKLSLAVSAACPYNSALYVSSEHCICQLSAGPQITAIGEDAVNPSVATLLH